MGHKVFPLCNLASYYPVRIERNKLVVPNGVVMAMACRTTVRGCFVRSTSMVPIQIQLTSLCFKRVYKLPKYMFTKNPQVTEHWKILNENECSTYLNQFQLASELQIKLNV